MYKGFELEDFYKPHHRNWLDLVRAGLRHKGACDLFQQGQDGVIIKPLYTVDDRLSVDVPMTLAQFGSQERGLEIASLISDQNLEVANERALAALENGADGLCLCLDPAEKMMAIKDETGFQTCLAGVFLDLAPVSLDAGFLAPIAAQWLDRLAKKAPLAPLRFGMDPIGSWLKTGLSPGPIEKHLDLALSTGASLAKSYARAKLFLASGTVIHEAGGTEIQEISFILSSALTYAKGLIASGLTPEEAFGRIDIGVSLDASIFETLAKIRALRLLWAHLTSAFGLKLKPHITGRGALRMLSRRDPWTNLVRLSMAGFSGVTAGIDTLLLPDFCATPGVSTAFSHQQSLAVALVLREEAKLDKVQDPAAGSFYIESLTDAFAEKAWAEFQAIEKSGGLLAGLRQGMVQKSVLRAQETLVLDMTEARRHMTGVTLFPPPEEAFVYDGLLPQISQDAALLVSERIQAHRLEGADDPCQALTPFSLEEAWQNKTKWEKVQKGDAEKTSPEANTGAAGKTLSSGKTIL